MRVVLAMLLALGAAAPAVAAETAAEKRVKAAFADQRKEGFKVRNDFWKGTLEGEAKKKVKHQLYRGNEYWFWLGTASAKDAAFLKVYDAKGRPVDVETVRGEGWTAVRVLPPKTETYHLVFTFRKAASSKKEAVSWAMTYGYR